MERDSVVLLRSTNSKPEDRANPAIETETDLWKNLNYNHYKRAFRDIHPGTFVASMMCISL
jgi:hypothetical protein